MSQQAHDVLHRLERGANLHFGTEAVMTQENEQR
jgi:hypothetical protein